MKFGSGLLVASVLLTPITQGQTVISQQIPSQKYQAFAQKLKNVEAWNRNNGTENDLDLLLFQSKNPQYFRKSQDGKLYLLVQSNQLSVELRAEFPRFEVPVVSLVAPSPTDAANVAAIDKIKRDVRSAVETLDAPCLIKEGRRGNQIEMSCSATPLQFLNYLMNMQVAECPAGAANQCNELDGQRFRIRHTLQERGKPTPIPLWDLLRDTLTKKIADGSWPAVDSDGHQRKDATVSLTSSENESPLMIMPRVLYEKTDAAERTKWTLITSLSAKDLVHEQTRVKLAELNAHVATKNAQTAQQNEALETLQRLSSAPSSSTALGALKLTDTDDDLVCTIEPTATARNVDKARLGVLRSTEFFQWSKTKGKKDHFDHLKPTADSLFAALQKRNCTIVIETVPNLASLAKDLLEEGQKIAVLEKAFGREAMADLMAQADGFASEKEQLLARSFGTSSSGVFKMFRQAGIVDKATFDAASKRMHASQYSNNDADVLQFVLDEKEAAQRKISAVAIRDERYSARARSDPFLGLSPAQASNQALAVLKRRATDLGSKGVADECANEIARAERETDSYLKDMSFRIAKDYCVTNAR